jgi:hypothetical protein
MKDRMKTMNQERKVIKTSKGILTHWSRTPVDMTPACGSKGDDWAEAQRINGTRAVSCYKCQRKHGR